MEKCSFSIVHGCSGSSLLVHSTLGRRRGPLGCDVHAKKVMISVMMWICTIKIKYCTPLVLGSLYMYNCQHSKSPRLRNMRFHEKFTAFAPCRFEEIIAHKETLKSEKKVNQRQRSNSLPVTKSRCSFVADFVLNTSPIRAEKEKLAAIKAKLKLSKPDLSFNKVKRGSVSGPSGTGNENHGGIFNRGSQGGAGQGSSSQFFSHSACNSPTVQRRGTTDRRASEKGSKRKLTMLDLKTFVETKLLSKSEKMLEKVGEGSQLLGVMCNMHACLIYCWKKLRKT